MSNIDEKAKNNFTIEMRIFENYEKVKHEIIKAIDFLRHSGTAMGMCKIFDNQDHGFWHWVIKPWFKPERFGITNIWFLLEHGTYFCSNEYLLSNGKLHTIKGIQWVEIPLSLVFDNRVFGYWFPPYKKYIPHRLRVLRLALKDLERIKEEYGKD